MPSDALSPVLVLRALVATLFVFVVPGFALQLAFWPRAGSVTRLERVVFTIALSMCATIIVGAVLGFLPHGSGRGYFQTAATGFPFVELGLVFVTVGGFYAAKVRGAFAQERARAPSPAAAGTPE